MQYLRNLALLIPIVLLGQCHQKPEFSSTQRVLNGQKLLINGQVKGVKQQPAPLTVQVLRSNAQHSLNPSHRGAMGDTIPLKKASFLKIIHQGELRYAFARPGDSLHLSFREGMFKRSLQVSGNRSKANRYLMAKQRMADTIAPQTRKEKQQIYALDPDDFTERLDSMKDTYLDFYQQFFGQQRPSEVFDQLEQANIRYHFYRQKLLYPGNYRKIRTGRYPDLSEDFKAYKEAVTFDKSRLFAVPAYQAFVRTTVNRRASKQIASESDIARTVVLKRVVDSVMTNDTLKARVLSRFLLQAIKTDGPSSVQGVLAYYRQLPYSEAMMKRLDRSLGKWEDISAREPAPHFAYPSLEGDTVSLASLKGSYVYIDAWATWCGPCIRQIPYLKTLQQAYDPSDVRFVSISLDKSRKKDKWRKFVNKRDLGGIQLFANGEGFNSSFARSYVVNSIPRFILIGPGGKIIDPVAQRPSGNIQVRLDTLIDR